MWGCQLGPVGKEWQEGGWARDREVFTSVDSAYERVGLEANEKKRVRRQLVCTTWGSELEGDSGWVGPPRGKLAFLMIVTALVATSGVCTEDILGTLTGIWAYALTYRRPLFSMMFHVYRCYSPDGRRDTPFRLGTWGRNELLLLALLGPFCFSNMRADYDP